MNGKTLKKLQRDDQGSALVWVAGGMLTLLGFATIAIDSGHLYGEHNKLQVTADAAVLAASYEFTQSKSETDARKTAIDFAERNMPTAEYGQVLASADIEFGQWKTGVGFSTSPVSSANAIRVTLRRTSASGNPADTLFAKLAGYSSMDMVSQSVAALGAPGCDGGTMFMAGEKVQLGQDVRLNAGT